MTSRSGIGRTRSYSAPQPAFRALVGIREGELGACKMAELEDVTLDGRPLDSLRVTDLRAALEERGLAKSGQKSTLMKRLKGVSSCAAFRLPTPG